MKIFCEIQDYGKRKIKYGGKKYHVHLKQFFFPLKWKSSIIFSLKKNL
jgi:hypothetical protein